MRKLGICAVVGVALGAGVLAALAVGAGGSPTTAHESTTTITDSQPTSVFSLCPEGQRTRALGVKARGLDRHDDQLSIIGLGRTGGHTAFASVRPAGPPIFLTAINYCAKRGDPKLEIHQVNETIPNSEAADKPGVVKASCEPNERLLFGGFETAGIDGALTLAGQYRSGKTWKTAVYNFGEPANVESTAYCQKGHAKLTTAKKQVDVGPGALKSATATCNRGKHVLFGGFKAELTESEAFVLLRSSQRVGKRGWRIGARNENPDSGGSLTAYAYCV